jgi:hypothetical protein
VSLSVTLRLKAYTDAFLARGLDLSKGDKIVLHSQVLENLMAVCQDELPHPTIFRVDSIKSKRTTHCGVLEYSGSDPFAAYFPLWMMHNMLLQDGDDIDLTLVQLPKVSFARMQPEHYSFARIPDPKVTLEYALRGFTCLTQGDHIQLSYNGQQFDLTVTELRTEAAATAAAAQPGNSRKQSNSSASSASTSIAGCVIDANVEVDFEAPQIAAPEKQFSSLPLNQLVQDIVSAGQYKYFRIRLPDASLGVRFELTATTGDPNLFISTSVDEPTIDQHTWRLAAGARARASKELMKLDITPRDPNFGTFYYIGVYGFNAESSFDLSVQQFDPKQVASAVPAGGYQLGASSSVSLSSAVPTSPPVSTDPNTKICDNCWRPISVGAYMMHSLQCARNSWRCGECGQVVNKKDKDTHAHCAECGAVVDPADMEKHIALTHRAVRCECGEEFDPSVLAWHKSDECRLRSVACRWCKLQLSKTDQSSHEQYCGARSVECDVCGEAVPRCQMDVHRAAVHHINPCLDPNGDRRKPGALALGEAAPPEAVMSPTGNDDEALQAAIAASYMEHQMVDDDLDAALAASLETYHEPVPAPSPPPAQQSRLSGFALSHSFGQPASAPAASGAGKSSTTAPPPRQRIELICPYCSTAFDDEDPWARHVELCALQFD